MKRLPLYFSFISFGIATLTIQIILIRELLVIFSGNELSIGLFLSQWLFAQAAGSSVFSKLRLSDRNILRNYVLLFTSFTGIFPIIIFLIRIIKPTLGILPGEQVSFFTLSLISFPVVLRAKNGLGKKYQLCIWSGSRRMSYRWITGHIYWNYLSLPNRDCLWRYYSGSDLRYIAPLRLRTHPALFPDQQYSENILNPHISYMEPGWCRNVAQEITEPAVAAI